MSISRGQILRVMAGGPLAAFLGCSARPLARQRLWLFRPELPEVLGCSHVLYGGDPILQECVLRGCRARRIDGVGSNCQDNTLYNVDDHLREFITHL
jgi:hypothetical protein